MNFLSRNSYDNSDLRRIDPVKTVFAKRAFPIKTACRLLVLLFACLVPAVQAAQVGLFMGSFDPPHAGILRIIEEARTRLSLDAVYVVPVSEPGDSKKLAPLDHRLAMMRLLTKDVPEAIVPAEEKLLTILARNPENQFAAMRDEIMSRRSPEDEIVQIIGEDALAMLIEQKQLPVPGERRRVAVFPRLGVPRIKNSQLAKQIRDGRVIRIDARIPDLASRNLRNQMMERRDPSTDALPEAISDYINREGLYGMPGSPLSGRILEGFNPVGYFSHPVLLYEVKTAPTFTSTQPGGLKASPGISAVSSESTSDFPPALFPVLANHPLHVTLFQATSRDSLDWLQRQGWRTLFGYIPVESEDDDRPRLFFGRQGLDWHLFVTDVPSPERFVSLVDTFRAEFGRLELPCKRLTVMTPVLH